MPEGGESQLKGKLHYLGTVNIDNKCTVSNESTKTQLKYWKDFPYPPVKDFPYPPWKDFPYPPLKDFPYPHLKDFSYPPWKDFPYPPLVFS